MQNDTNADILKAVADLLANNLTEDAAELIQAKYPFIPIRKVARQYTPTEMVRVFVRDGFLDRYKGTRLVFPPALRLISHYLPTTFPFHKNGKMTEGHIAFWELLPTIDHVRPVSRGGKNDEENWATCSMITNSIKANWTLDQLGWSLLPPGGQDWDGLLPWFVGMVDRTPALLSNSYFKRWHAAAKTVCYPGAA